MHCRSYELVLRQDTPPASSPAIPNDREKSLDDLGLSSLERLELFLQVEQQSSVKGRVGGPGYKRTLASPARSALSDARWQAGWCCSDVCRHSLFQLSGGRVRGVGTVVARSDFAARQFLLAVDPSGPMLFVNPPQSPFPGGCDSDGVNGEL